MPCVRKSTLSSALTAATATISSIYGGASAPASTPAAVQTYAPVAASSASSSATTSSIAAQASGASGSSTVPTATGNQTMYAGINIAGFEFGCGTDGTCTVVCFPSLFTWVALDCCDDDDDDHGWLTLCLQDGITVPSTAAAQMQHFKKDDGMNIFRLPVGWQYLTNNVIGGDLDSTNFGKYDALMQDCLDLGVKVRDCTLAIGGGRETGQMADKGFLTVCARYPQLRPLERKGRRPGRPHQRWYAPTQTPKHSPFVIHGRFGHNEHC